MKASSASMERVVLVKPQNTTVRPTRGLYTASRSAATPRHSVQAGSHITCASGHGFAVSKNIGNKPQDHGKEQMQENQNAAAAAATAQHTTRRVLDCATGSKSTCMRSRRPYQVMSWLSRPNGCKGMNGCKRAAVWPLSQCAVRVLQGKPGPWSWRCLASLMKGTQGITLLLSQGKSSFLFKSQLGHPGSADKPNLKCFAPFPTPHPPLFPVYCSDPS